MDLEHFPDIDQCHCHDASFMREMPYDVETSMGYWGIFRGPRLVGKRSVLAQRRGESVNGRGVDEKL